MSVQKDRELLQSARHWERLAKQEERMAAWDRKIGIAPPSGIPSASDHKAVLFHNTAKAMRLQVETGVLHCNCHCLPNERCPSHPRNRSRVS